MCTHADEHILQLALCGGGGVCGGYIYYLCILHYIIMVFCNLHCIQYHGAQYTDIFIDTYAHAGYKVQGKARGTLYVLVLGEFIVKLVNSRSIISHFVCLCRTDFELLCLYSSMYVQSMC